MKVKLAVLLFLVFTIVYRLIPHPANLAPVSALALFSGAYLPKRYAIPFAILALLISDFFLGFYGSLMLWVYSALIVSVVIGYQIKRYTVVNLVTASLLSSLVFFIITNLAVWIPGDYYARDLNGLISCFTLAIPFFRNTIIGDLIFTVIMFKLYELTHNLTIRFLPHKVYRLIF